MSCYKTFVPASKPASFPLGKYGTCATQIELYERLTDKNCDLSEIAAVIEPVIVAAQIEPTELYDVIANANVPLQ